MMQQFVSYISNFSRHDMCKNLLKFAFFVDYKRGLLLPSGNAPLPMTDDKLIRQT